MNLHELDPEWFERARSALRQLCALERHGYLSQMVGDFASQHEALEWLQQQRDKG